MTKRKRLGSLHDLPPHTDCIEGSAIVASKSASKMCARIGGGGARLNPGYFPVTAFVSRFCSSIDSRFAEPGIAFVSN